MEKYGYKKPKRLREILWNSFSSFLLGLEKINVSLEYVMKIGSSNKLSPGMPIFFKGLEKCRDFSVNLLRDPLVKDLLEHTVKNTES